MAFLFKGVSDRKKNQLYQCYKWEERKSECISNFFPELTLPFLCVIFGA